MPPYEFSGYMTSDARSSGPDMAALRSTVNLGRRAREAQDIISSRSRSRLGMLSRQMKSLPARGPL